MSKKTLREMQESLRRHGTRTIPAGVSYSDLATVAVIDPKEGIPALRQDFKSKDAEYRLQEVQEVCMMVQPTFAYYVEALAEKIGARNIIWREAKEEGNAVQRAGLKSTPRSLSKMHEDYNDQAQFMCDISACSIEIDDMGSSDIDPSDILTRSASSSEAFRRHRERIQTLRNEFFMPSSSLIKQMVGGRINQIKDNLAFPKKDTSFPILHFNPAIPLSTDKDGNPSTVNVELQVRCSSIHKMNDVTKHYEYAKRAVNEATAGRLPNNTERQTLTRCIAHTQCINYMTLMHAGLSPFLRETYAPAFHAHHQDLLKGNLIDILEADTWDITNTERPDYLYKWVEKLKL